MKLSVIIPVYNEAATILDVIKQVRAVEIGMPKEIIVVDGDSNDGTREKLKQEENKSDLKIIYENTRKGKGAAVCKGLGAVTGDIIIIQDADLEVSPGEYPKLLKPILDGKAEVVYGSRFANGKGITRLGSFIGNKIITGVTNILFLRRLTDVGTAYKVFRKEVIQGIKFKCNDFDFDAEITVKILKNKIDIVEMPINYNPRSKNEGKKLQWTVGFKVLIAIFKYRFIN